MTKPLIRIHDLATDEVIDREMTDEEYAKYEAIKKADNESKVKLEADKAALLAKLGITADEAKLLLN